MNSWKTYLMREMVEVENEVVCAQIVSASRTSLQKTAEPISAVPWVEVDQETAMDHTVRLSRSIRVF